MKNERVARNFN